MTDGRRRGVLAWSARVLGAPLRVRDDFAVADAIVVLGAPLTAGGALSAVVAERVTAGVALWQRGGAPLLCVTGGAAPGQRPEAIAMAEHARALGIPAAALRIEMASRTTAENARRCAELLTCDGVRTVWLVTQPFHGRRARRCFHRAGFATRVWHIEDSLEYAEPPRALRWIIREYAAWARALVQR